MSVDWKKISASKGYRSLKEAMIRDIQRVARFANHPENLQRAKKEIYSEFKWIIGRAFHYADTMGTTVDVILDIWEADRDYNWRNYYQPSKIPRLILSPHVAHQNPINYYRKDKWYRNDTVRRKKRIFETIVLEQKRLSKRQGKKKRWSAERKRREKRYKESVSQLLERKT